MSTADCQTVTIDRMHFETILRRANFDPNDVTTSTVSVSRSEYDGFQSVSAKYANLRRNLLRGGVGEETIDLLSQDDATIEEQKAPTASAPAPAGVPGNAAALKPPVSPIQPQPEAARAGSNNYGNYNTQPKSTANFHIYTKGATDWADAEGLDDDSASGGGPVGDFDNNGYNSQTSVRPFYERQCVRSLLLCNLAEGTTHGDVTEAVRGGQLLDVYLRPHDRTAAVSFLQAADARAFFNHVRRHDLYIRHKRVDIRWNNHQFILPGHVASKIGSGASRNLVIRRCDPRLTEAVIRNDLEHIHNLVVIKVKLMGGNCYIKTNSVHNALFAKTCMMSQLKYKHSKIDWDVDECCQPLEQPPAAKLHKEHQITKRSSRNFMTNRFQLLNLDDNDEEDGLLPDFSPTKTVGITA